MNAPTLLTVLDARLAAAFAALDLPAELARAVHSGKPDLADVQCNTAMQAAKRLKRPPLELATAIAAQLTAAPDASAAFDSVEVAPPGFINLRLSAALLAQTATAQSADPDLSIQKVQAPQRIVVDFGGPNVAKPLHVGHLRSLVIGESVRRTLTALGHDVISDVHLGDWGLQMGQLISEIAQRQPDLPYFVPGSTGPFPDNPPVTLAELEALYPEAAAACKADPARLELARVATAELQAGRPGYRALWRQLRTLSLTAQKVDFATLGAHFDLLLGESDTDPLIAPMLQDLISRGLAVEDDGALVIAVAEAADGQRPLPPLILRKRDGAVTYATTDMATIQMRLAGPKPATRIIYVVDQRQADHFRQVFRAAKRAGITAALEHAGFGTVNGPGNKALKTREGGTVKLADLLNEAIAKAHERIEGSERAAHLDAGERQELAHTVGVAAVKFADLSSHRISGYIFDAERLVAFEGKTGPYMQYACTRIASILSKAAERGFAPGAIVPSHPQERRLVLDCARFPDSVTAAADSLLPSELAEYAFTLAQSFSRFYADCPVLPEPDAGIRASRLALCQLTHKVLSRAMDLLGIAVPHRM